MLTKISASVQGRDGSQRLWQRKEKASVHQGSDFGDKDLLGNGPPSITERFKDTSGLKTLDLKGSRAADLQDMSLCCDTWRRARLLRPCLSPTLRILEVVQCANLISLALLSSDATYICNFGQFWIRNNPNNAVDDIGRGNEGMAFEMACGVGIIDARRRSSEDHGKVHNKETEQS